MRMQRIPLPEKLVFTKEKKPHTTTMELSSCSPGYGTTLGNALRRVLLSTLEGAAVTAFKIKGVSHEFSTVPGVKEDAVEMMLNIKRLRFKMHSDEPITLTLKVKGEKEVTAKDFEKNSQVEVMNESASIATLTASDAIFELEVLIERGQGYVMTEAREKQKLDVGMIAIDAMFNPVQSVATKVENVRVGKMTNFDKLQLTVETDGSISPEDAVRESAKILRDHINVVIGEEVVTETKEEEIEVEETKKPSKPKKIAKKKEK